MASRNMRRSRRGSPMVSSATTTISVKAEPHIEDTIANPSGEWVEPVLRPPVPSFEDYKGLERHGVLEHMAPLGTLPNSKVKGRLKQHEPPRRAAHMRNGEVKVNEAKERVDVSVSVASPAPRHSQPRETEDTANKNTSSRERDIDREYVPPVKEPSSVVTIKGPTVPPAAMNGTPSSRTTQGRLKLKQIVDSAIARSTSLGDPVLGNAVKELYEESLRNPAVADLLDAVLTQRPSPEQTAEFQSRIRTARKRHKDLIAARRDRTAQAISNSATAKNSKSSVTRHSESARTLPSPPILKKDSPNSNHSSMKQSRSHTEIDGSPSKEERPPKRVKRSKSTSSDSSLSSLDSTVEEFPPTLEPTRPSINNHTTSPQIPPSKQQPSSGPRLGTFPVRSTDSATRKLTTANSQNLHPTPEDVTAKKREQMRQKSISAIGVQTIQDSAIRATPSPVNPQTNSPVAAVTERNHRERSRLVSSQRRGRDDHDSLDSPASSSFGDLLVPPPPGTSRGATPSQLARSSKGPKKAARIKMSPLKKRNTTTAGRGAEVDGSIPSNIRNDFTRTENIQNDGNSDFCTACSGDGSLLCCEGCTRAFHLTCCEPPIGSTPKGEWFCNKCTDARTTAPPPTVGIFEVLLADSNGKNPVSYSLPEALRNYYDGVKTGEDGEYEEASAIKTNKTRGGYEELPNNFRLKDTKDNSILCYQCSGSSMGQREIVSCDYCNLSWHLDCLDPPLAIAPKKKHNGLKPKITAWMCPNHIDSELNRVGLSVQKSDKGNGAARRFKIRRPKVYSIIDVALKRGFKNNGLIEVENDPSDDETYTKNMSGQIYRVHEKGIKLDFIDRIKRVNEENSQKAHMHRAAKKTRKNTRPVVPQEEPYQKRPFHERKAALNLLQLANSDESALSQDSVQNLISTLMAEAPDSVEKLIENTETNGEKDRSMSVGEVSEEERRDLQLLIEMAFRRLASGSGDQQ